MDWLMVAAFVVSWLFAAIFVLVAVGVLRNSFPEAAYFSYAPPLAIGVVLLLLFVWIGILRPAPPVTGLPLLPLGAGALLSFGLAAMVGFFNRPRSLVPKHSREQPGVFQDWLERRRRRRAKRRVLGRVIVPQRLVVGLKMTGRSTWKAIPAYRFRNLALEAASLDALEAELVRRCADYFQNPSPANTSRLPQLVLDWWDERCHALSPHATVPHIHTDMRVVEMKIQHTAGGRYIAKSSEPELAVEAPSLDGLMPLVRASLLEYHESRAQERHDLLRFVYVRDWPDKG